MGAEDLSSAILDTGPLIHLAEINSLPLLVVFSQLHFPELVWQEFLEHNPTFEEAASALQPVRRHAVSNSVLDQFAATNNIQELHAGETACLYLCQHLQVAVLLTDDLAARAAALRAGLTPVGSLGIVVRAFRLGRLSLSEAEQKLAALFDVSSLYVTRAIVELAIKQLRQHASAD